MRERFVCWAQAMSMRGPEYQQTTSGAVVKDGEQLCLPAQSEEAPAKTSGSIVSPLTTFLTRSEFVPYILEQEKSLLVIKEHDYAKAPDRAAVLQASSMLEKEAESRNYNGREGEEFAAPKPVDSDQLLSCFGELTRLRYSLLRSEDRREAKHLREVVGLQAALIREQQEQLYLKERELASTRKDRDQLEARLERMERRLAVHQKRNTANASDADSSAPPTTFTPSVSVARRISRVESLTLSEGLTRNRSSSVESARSRTRLASHSSPSIEEGHGIGGKRTARKRIRVEENSVALNPTPKRVQKTTKRSELRTKMEYEGLELTFPAADSVVEHALPSVNHVDGLVRSRNLENESPALKQIIVPSWKIALVALSTSSEPSTDPEDLTDEAFTRRHKKHEEDEKRRKRWDLQRARALLEHEELLKKYNKKSGGDQLQQQEKKKDKVTSLLPKIEEVEELEIQDTIVVSAFGFPIPQLKRREFSLPWFDLDLRETQENVRTTRSKARASRSSGSFDDS